MDERSLSSLEWDRLLSLLSYFAFSEEGKERLKSLKPIFDQKEIEKIRSEVTEWERSEQVLGNFSFEGYKRLQLKCPDGLYLKEDILNDLKSIIKKYISLLIWLKDKKVEKESLLNLIYEDEFLYFIQKKLEKTFDEMGGIADTASDELYNIRREKERALEKCNKILISIMEKYKTSSFSQSSPTIINGRLVLPVLTSKKNLIKGIILDTSSTGSTSYIEPVEVIEYNNTISEFELKEKDEIKKILTNLTKEINSHLETFNKIFEVMEYLDTIVARVRFKKAIKGNFPSFGNGESLLYLKNGKHPFLMPELNEVREKLFSEKPKEFVVPLNLKLSLSDLKSLILSGPNGGGKSVALKTIGLLALMNQCGIPIPADEDSVFPLFLSIVSIIGDPQSISNGSSTFTARLEHLSSELINLKEPFLILLDEPNSGTDPLEGSTLVKEILNFLHKKRGFVVITTHDETIKLFALSKEGMGNGAFGFSEKEGKPTYVLEIGVVGKSRALEIAEKAGIPREIVEAAKRELPEEGKKLHNLFSEFENKILELDKLKKENEEKLKEISERLKQIELEKAKLIEEKENFIKSLPTLTNKWRDEFLSKLKSEVNKQKIKKISINEAYNVINKAVKELNIDKSETKIKDVIYPDIDDFVRVLPLGFKGRVKKVEKESQKVYVDVEGKELSAYIGDIEILNDLEHSKNDTFKKTYSLSEYIRELFLLGKSVEDATIELDYFLDKCFYDGVEKAKIIHGIGTGKLKRAIRDFLKKDKRIEKVEDADLKDGGEGVTIVFFKK